MTEITLPLEPNCMYHIFNRGNNKNKIFFKDENYRFFLKRYGEYMKGYVDTFAYCLLANHFHLMFRVKSLNDIELKFSEDFAEIPKNVLKKIDGLDLTSFENLSSREILSKLEERQQFDLFSWAISEKMRRFLMSYAKAINKQEERVGSLLQKPFRRKLVETENYFVQLIWYIHNNPVHHNFCADLTTYQWSSYSSFISNLPTKLNRQEVLDWFGGKEKFIAFHEESTLLFQDAKYWME